MKTLLLGIDAFDPSLFERLLEQGAMPNLSKYTQNNRYRRFEVSNPPQSEVSWTSIATGLNPAAHGLYDFVHRDTATYALHVSLLPTQKQFGAVQFVRPYNTPTIFDDAAAQGYPATSLWWAATFPARPESPVRTLPGLGTPDIQGKLGVGSLYTTAESPAKQGKTPVYRLQPQTGGDFGSNFYGPLQKDQTPMQRPFRLRLLNPQSVQLTFGKTQIQLTPGTWSPILHIVFDAGFLVKVHAITRVIITHVEPLSLYALPLQIHPLHALWRYGTPGNFVKQTWQQAGPYLTIGWPQDTTGLEDGCISDEQFLALCTDIVNARTKLLQTQLAQFREGLLGNIFDSLDRIQHMLLRDRPDLVENWYKKFDHIIGLTEAWFAASPGKKGKLLIVSDHGFARFDTKVHLNRFLAQQGWLHARSARADTLTEVDWTNTRAYAIGLNSLYLNLQGREGKGTVTLAEKDAFIEEIRAALLNWHDERGGRVVARVQKAEHAFEGALLPAAPDLVVGYAPGFRASQQTGLGGWEQNPLEPNRDHWGADHCIDPAEVPGVLFANFPLDDFPAPSYRDIPTLAINTRADINRSAPPPKVDPQDEKAVKERLRSLGYL
ncbi:MAG: hypothetical protein OHK0052_12940 [Anaerolineales bacterium]